MWIIEKLIRSVDWRVKNYFFQFKPHSKTFEPKKLKLDRVVLENCEKNLKWTRIFIEIWVEAATVDFSKFWNQVT